MFLKPCGATTDLFDKLNEILVSYTSNRLSDRQMYCLSMILTGIVSTGALNISRIAYFSFGIVTMPVISALIHRSKIPWNKMFFASTLHVFQLYLIDKIHLQVDDTDLSRSKIVKTIFGVFRTLHKPTNGYQNAQNIVLISVCAFGVTFPIAFKFYVPDPLVSEWHKKKKKAKKAKKKIKLPPEPKRRQQYPTRNEITLILLRKTKRWLKIVERILGREIKVVSITGDAAYLEPKLVRAIKRLFPNTQYISQIKSNQLVKGSRGEFIQVKNWFTRMGNPVKGEAMLRNSMKKFEYHSARLFVKSHGCKMHIIALRYEGETDYRYLCAIDLSWRTIDIIRAYSLRWLIEVEFQDYKGYCALGRRACLQGAKGAYVSVFLSLLVDNLLLTHKDQLGRHRAGQQLYTAGSIKEQLQCEINISTIKEIIDSPKPQERLSQLVMVMNDQLKKAMKPSKKHVRDPTMFDIGPSPQLAKRHLT